jgi:two-component system, LuxR family, sensor kinase FixL
MSQTETILVVEDDAGIATLQLRSLTRAGYTVEWLADLTEAGKRIKRGGVDLLLLDNRLGDGQEGLTFYRQLKADGFDLPVIIVTAYSDDATVIRALREGVLDYVTKSAEYLSYLPEAVRRALGQVGTRRQLQETNDQLRRALADLEEKTEELRLTTQQLWQSAKLASVGELAAGIAHELNNPLGIVSLRLEGVLTKTADDDPRRAALEIIEQELDRMASLVATLLQFSRPGHEATSSVDVSEEMDRTLDLMHHHMRKRGIEAHPVYASERLLILADRQKLRQVFLNLVTNACDAMTAGGTLTLQVRRQSFENCTNGVVVEVADTGHGIPADILPKVMDPFFTTKEEGKGTGLGLAICRRIVQEHQGTLQIDSKVGKGTTVRILFPVNNELNSSQ